MSQAYPHTQNRKWRPLCALISAGLVFTPTAWAQDDEDDDKDLFELNPFVVSTSEQDAGYYASSTLAGSRLNTNVGDLAASITIVTKQQMEDTASVDINDAFLYEANTEGFLNYTPSGSNVTDRGTIKDQGAGYSFANTGAAFGANTANRVRGIGAPSIGVNFYNALAEIPFDIYNTDTVEINRGPNSLLFGLGNPAGIVNQSTASAQLGQKRTEVNLRTGSWGLMRGSISHNQPITDNLAIYGAALYDDRGFARKPSYERISRYYGALTYAPFDKLMIRANAEYYSNEHRRPNSLTPRDMVTPWYEAGRPVYDPTTNGIKVLDTGQNFGPYLRDVDDPRWAEDWTGGYVGDSMLSNTDSPNWVDGIDFIDARVGRPVALVGQDHFWVSTQKHPGGRETQNYSNPAPAEGDRTLDQWITYSQNWSRSAIYNTPADTVSNYIIPGVTDKSIYNWEKHNTLAMNYGDENAKTYNLEIDYEVLPNLFVQLGWFRQEFDSFQNYTVQQQTGATLYIDTNLKLPNGENNPFFGLPYVEDYLPDTFLNDAENQTLRAQIAYTLDFTENDGWSSWLGRHRLLGVATRWELDTLRLRLRGTHVGGDPRWLPDADLNEAASSWRYYGNSSRIRRNYYLARPGDPEGKVTAGGPTYWGQPDWQDVNGRVTGFGGVDSAPTWWYNWRNESWEQATAGYGTVTHDAGSGRTAKQVDSFTAAWQGYFWDDRIVTTVGWRRDKYEARNTIGVAGLDRNQYLTEGFLIPDKSYNRWTDSENGEIADSREELTEDTLTTGIVVVPLRWEGGDFRLHYNKSENFDPPGAAQTDLFGNPLPIPRGEGEDYGFSVSMFDNKFVVKFSWFEATSEAERTGAAGTLISRLQRIDYEQMVDWATAIAYFDTLNIDLGSPEPEGGRPPLTDSQQSALESRVEELVGLRYDWPTGLNVGATQTSEAEGMEIQMVYNPMRNWTIKFTAGQQETVFSAVAPEYDAWVNERMPLWTSATSPLTAANDFNTDGDNNPNTFLYNGERPADLTTFWGAYGYNGQATLDNGNGWFSTQDFFDLAVDSQVGAAKAQEGIVSPGQREWRWNLITNYQFIEGPLENWNIGGGLRWEDETIIGFYGMETDPTRPGVLLAPDTSRPIKDDAQFHLDFWVGWRTKIFDGKVDMKIQLNVRDALEDGEIRPIRADYAGNYSAYRIIDPRQWFLSASFIF